MSDDRPVTDRELRFLDERINHISARLDNHIAACTWRFIILLSAVSVATGVIALMIEHHV